MPGPDAAPDLDAARDLLAFIDASPSPYHAVAEAARRLADAGFEAVAETASWPAGPGPRFLVRDGGLIAWSAPRSGPARRPFRIVGAHTDSPNLRIRPRPDGGRAGARQLSVEVYGGALTNSWLGRDLGLSGRVALRGGELVLVRVERPVLHLPQLAIHLDREVTTKGLQLDPQHHLDPVWSLGPPETDGFVRFLAKEAGVPADDISYWDTMVHDLAPSAIVGRDDEFIAAPRLDNLCSCWAAVRALVAVSDDGDGDRPVPVVCLFDHEEVGSTSATGAGGPLLARTLERLVFAAGGQGDDLHRAMAASTCVSADMAHATHPNYAERHDPNHHIALNGGPVLKTNVNQRYATDARSAAAFLDACDDAGIAVQRYSHRNDLPCGSTIGPMTAARLGIPTVDVGAPQLAMHSARELMGSADPGPYAAALAAYLAQG